MLRPGRDKKIEAREIAKLRNAVVFMSVHTMGRWIYSVESTNFVSLVVQQYYDCTRVSLDKVFPT